MAAAERAAAAEQVVAAEQLFAAAAVAYSNEAAAEAWAAIPAVLDALSSTCFLAAAGSNRGAYRWCYANAGARRVLPCEWCPDPA